MTVPACLLAGALLLGAPESGDLLDAAALESAIDALAAEHPDTVRVLPVGASRAGRPIQALRIGAREEVPGRPAILVVANLEGPLVWTSSLALELARQLAVEDGGDAAELRERATVFVIPRANPDAAQARFREPLAEVRASGRGVDDDRDGRAGEDARADVDGDGVIATMRVVDPEGEWVEDPADPRVLVKAERAKGERGRYALYPEGLDDDGDGEIAEDPAADAEVNANFAFRWEELAPRAGRYPTDEPEVLALTEFVLAHPEIALVVTFGEEDNLVREPATLKSGRRGEESAGLHADDQELFAELGRRYRELTGDETKGVEEQPGSFAAWAYHHRGLVTLATLPWSVPAELPEPPDPPAEDKLEEEQDEVVVEEVDEAPEPSDDAKRLAWLEAHNVDDAFVAWKAFEHPTLGPVEIGGFRPYATLEPTLERFVEVADTQLAFLLALGDLLPRLALVELEAKPLGAGLFEVSAVLENDALMPFACAMAGDTRTVRPARVRLVLSGGAELVAGEPQVLVPSLDGVGGRRELRWLARASDANDISIEVDSDHAGSFTVQVEGN